ncbi:hypothetical protein OOK06_23805 [Streptomyces sp. NBC_00340]|uniref:hypothetical protein n=1 Tax=Streptomyces sp. NBC_00340 TaxID=2975716 RepID=UPI00225A58B1|nr:hypothetical protein [Streptomyces sp. NBC_00340]MCX5135092.1 hypothetical protein [Streptomyces sp. NBC_00340]
MLKANSHAHVGDIGSLRLRMAGTGAFTMVKKPVRAALGDVWLNCQVCKGDLFRERDVLLNSTGMEFMKLAWADESATGLICWRCGYVHLFVNRDIKLYRADK